MRNIKHFCLAFALAISPATASVADPVLDAARKILNDQRDADDNFDYWNSNIYLFRFRLDVTGDGKPELFVGSSSMVDRSPINWSVYFSTSGDELSRTAENVLLNPKGFYVEQSSGPIKLSWVFGKQSTVVIHEYAFGADGRAQYNMRKIEGEDARKRIGEREDWRDALGLGVRVEDLEIEKVLLAEYLEDPTVTWRKYDHSHAPESQNLAEGEKPFLKQAENFSAERAVQLATTEEITDPPAGSKPRSTTPPATSLPTPVEESTPKLKTSPTPTTVETESSSGFPIVPVAILAAVIVGIAIYLHRRKST